MKLNSVYTGHILDILTILPDDSIDCVVTSPPYWQLRDYGKDAYAIWGGDSQCKHEWERIVTRSDNFRHREGKTSTVGTILNKSIYTNPNVKSAFCKKCNAWWGQLGLEPTFNQYIQNLCIVFEKIKKSLKPKGTLWVNLGDTYAGSGGAGGDWTKGGRAKEPKWKQPKIDYPAKSLFMIPFRFATKMVDDFGWILRNTIIWQKPNCIPSPVKDRFTVNFEYLFLFSQSNKYFFNQQFDPYIEPLKRWGGAELKADKEILDGSPSNYKSAYRRRKMRPNPKGKNKRTVWNIPTKPLKDAHFATFPLELIRTPIDAGTPSNGVVFDPFIGAGTVGMVALELKRNFVGVELNPKYVKIANKRITDFCKEQDINKNINVFDKKSTTRLIRLKQLLSPY